MRETVRVLAVLAISVAFASDAAARDVAEDFSAGERCDRLAAFDGGVSNATPVPLSELDAAATVSACGAAAKDRLGSTRYLVQLARGFLKARQPHIAAYHLSVAAHAGDAAAMFILGQMHHSGLGVGLDHVRAKDLYTQALARGYERAAVGLVILLERAGGPVHDPETALALRRAHGLEGRRLPRLP